MKIGVFKKFPGSDLPWVVQVGGSLTRKSQRDGRALHRFATRAAAAQAGVAAVAAFEARSSPATIDSADAAVLLSELHLMRKRAVVAMLDPVPPEVNPVYLRRLDYAGRANAIGRALVALGVEGVPAPLVLP